MKYRIIKLGSKDHNHDCMGYFKVQKHDGQHWESVDGTLVKDVNEAEALMQRAILLGQTEDEVIKEVTV